MSRRLVLIEQGALIASIATTALQFQDLSHTNWVARAFLVASLMLSLAAVFLASRLYGLVGRLLIQKQLETFISVDMDVVLGQLSDVIESLRSALALLGWGKNSPKRIRENMIKLPSAASCLLLTGPRLLLTGSLLSFVVALGIYLGFLMSLHLTDDNGPNDARNVFIFYVVVAVVCYILFSQCSSILSGRMAVSQDEGDRIMKVLLKRRRDLLKDHGPTAWHYKRWKQQNEDEMNKRKSQKLKKTENRHDEDPEGKDQDTNDQRGGDHQDRRQQGDAQPEGDDPDDDDVDERPAGGTHFDATGTTPRDEEEAFETSKSTFATVIMSRGALVHNHTISQPPSPPQSLGAQHLSFQDARPGPQTPLPTQQTIAEILRQVVAAAQEQTRLADEQKTLAQRQEQLFNLLASNVPSDTSGLAALSNRD